MSQKTEIKGCARCGQDHSVEFKPLTASPGQMQFSHYAICENTGQPILMRMVDDSELAVKLESQTLVGFIYRDQTFPRSEGNCFSVTTESGKSFRIVNFCVENLHELTINGISWPFKIKVLHGDTAVLHDERIPPSWYAKEFCENCCPQELLPLSQKLILELRKKTGEVEEIEVPGQDYRLIKTDRRKRPTVPGH